MELLKSDLEGEVINGEKLNNSLCVSKALVSKTVEDHDSNAKALKKAKAEVTRLTNKNDEAQNTIEKVRETMKHSFSEMVHNELCQKKYYLEN